MWIYTEGKPDINLSNVDAMESFDGFGRTSIRFVRLVEDGGVINWDFENIELAKATLEYIRRRLVEGLSNCVHIDIEVIKAQMKAR